MPSFSITRRDEALPGAVNATTSVNPSSSNAKRRHSRAASVAYPRFQWSKVIRHPISTHGVKCDSKAGRARPVIPMNSPLSRSSSAKNVNPCAAWWAMQRSTRTSLSARVSVAGKCCITRGSPFKTAKGARSESRHCRRTSRCVVSIALPLLGRKRDQRVQQPLDHLTRLCIGQFEICIESLWGVADQDLGTRDGDHIEIEKALAQMILAPRGTEHTRRRSHDRDWFPRPGISAVRPRAPVDLVLQHTGDREVVFGRGKEDRI